MKVFLVGTLFLSGALGASWDYNNTNWGPPSYPNCAGQRQSPINIDSSNVTMADYSDLAFSIGYKMDMVGKYYNNGHGLKFSVDPKYSAFVSGGPLPAGKKYKLAQYHFHWGSHPVYAASEHTFNGKHYAAEMHFVHHSSDYDNLTHALTTGDGNALAVVGVFLDMKEYEGMPARNRDDLDVDAAASEDESADDRGRRLPGRHHGWWNWRPRPYHGGGGSGGGSGGGCCGCCSGGCGGMGGSRSQVSESVRNLIRASEATSRLPIGETVPLTQTLSHYFTDIDHLTGVYSYLGSLTTPTCDEKVIWILLNRPLTVPKELLDAFRMNKDDHGQTIEDNHRPVMPLNGRTINLYHPA